MKSLKYVVALLLLLSLSACGGGGSTPSTQIPTKAVLKLNLTDGGLLFADRPIIGTVITITLPANVTPELVNGVIASTVITPSGTFAGWAVAPIYTASTNTIQMAFVNAAEAGTAVAALVGEVATITLQLANNAAPTATSFTVSVDSVTDAGGNTVAGLGAIVSSVTLQ